MIQLTHLYITTGETIVLTIQTFVSKVMSLLFNMVSRFVMVFPEGSAVKNLLCSTLRRYGFNPWVRKMPWRRAWQPTPVFWPGEFYGLYSPWGVKQSDRTERLSLSESADGDCSHESKRRLLLGRKVMPNLDSIFKSRDITLPTKIRLVTAMVFPVVMCGCESWTIKKAEY